MLHTGVDIQGSNSTCSLRNHHSPSPTAFDRQVHPPRNRHLKSFMYEQQLSTINPGLILILVDQSASMRAKYADSSKADFAALAVNRVIGEIIQACTAGEEIKDRCHVGVIGYGSKSELLFIDSASQLATNTEVINIPKRITDGAGGFIEVSQVLRVFVPSVSQGSTDMAGAFRLAHQGIEKFINVFQHSFPPIVINITDGEPDDMNETMIAAQNVQRLKTSDGSVIVMNAYISESKGLQIQLPASSDSFQSNRYAQFLYDISSVLPEPILAESISAGFDATSGSRGFIFNADPDALVRFLRFGTSVDAAIVKRD